MNSDRLKSSYVLESLTYVLSPDLSSGYCFCFVLPCLILILETQNELFPDDLRGIRE